MDDSSLTAAYGVTDVTGFGAFTSFGSSLSDKGVIESYFWLKDGSISDMSAFSIVVSLSNLFFLRMLFPATCFRWFDECVAFLDSSASCTLSLLVQRMRFDYLSGLPLAPLSPSSLSIEGSELKII